MAQTLYKMRPFNSRWFRDDDR